ncbi:hypothetical protein H5410_036206, partial [Solanum commersonii]
PGKCLYTTVRELVENALDSAESISELPVVEITIEEIGRSKFNPMNVEMKPYMMILRQKRLVRCVSSDLLSLRWQCDLYFMLTQISLDGIGIFLNTVSRKDLPRKARKVKDPAATKAIRGREASYYRVTCM